jgi:ribokinase
MRVLVLGTAMVDETMATSVFPHAGATVIAGPAERDLGGKGANQALVMRRAGLDVRLVAPVGGDAAGEWVAGELAGEGLDPADLVPVDVPTDRSLIFVGPGGENAIASIVAAAECIDERLARESVEWLGAGDLLVMQGNLTLDATRAALQAARAAGATTLLNPSPARPDIASLVPLADCLVANEGEARLLGGGGDALAAAEALRAAGAGLVVVTLGARGALALDADGAVTVPAEPVTPLDTTGAGDVFTAVFAACRFGRAMPLEASLRAAGRAAALAVTRHGTRAAFPTRAEIAAIIGAGR